MCETQRQYLQQAKTYVIAINCIQAKAIAKHDHKKKHTCEERSMNLNIKTKSEKQSTEINYYCAQNGIEIMGRTIYLLRH
jgi:hypothetical protein